MNHMTHLKDALHIPDTQSERDERHLAIQRVGVKDVRYPLQLKFGKTAQPTIGRDTAGGPYGLSGCHVVPTF